MTFTEAIDTISGGIDYLYEEGIEDIDEIEEAERVFALLVSYLKKKGVNCLEDLDR
jgi:hypothetical protein